MKTCSRCGYTDIEDDAIFCPECGMKLDTPEEKPEENTIEETIEESEQQSFNTTTDDIDEADVPGADAESSEDQVSDNQIAEGHIAAEQSTPEPVAQTAQQTPPPTYQQTNAQQQMRQQPVTKKPKRGVLIGILAGLGVLILLAFVGCGALVYNMVKGADDGKTENGKPDKTPVEVDGGTTGEAVGDYTVYYDSYGIYEYDIKSGTSDKLTSLDDDYSDMYISIADYVQISDDGQYATYIKDFEEDSATYSTYGTLYYTNRTLDEDKREDIEIADKVISYDVLSDNTVIYQTVNSTLYKVNLQSEDMDKRRLGTSISTMQMSKDGSSYIWINQSGLLQAIKSGDDEPIRLADDAEYLEYASDDLSSIYYTNYDADLKCISELGTPKLIDTEVSTVYYIEDTGHIYYTKGYKDLKIGEFVNDKTGVSGTPIESDLPGGDVETTEAETSEAETTVEDESVTESETSVDGETQAGVDLSDYDYLKQLYEEYGYDEYYSSFEDFYDEYKDYLGIFGDGDSGYDYGYDDYTYDDYGYDDYGYGDYTWPECLEMDMSYTGVSELYMYDGQTSTKVADRVIDVAVPDGAGDDRICYVQCSSDKITVTEVPDDVYALIDEINTDIIGKSHLYIAVGTAGVDLGMNQNEYYYVYGGLVHNCTDDSIYYTVIDEDATSDLTDSDYEYYDYYDKDWPTVTYRIDYDSSKASKPVEVGKDIGVIRVAIGDRYITMDYSDSYDTTVSDLYVDGKKIATGVYTFFYDDADGTKPLDFMENTYVEDDYSYNSYGTVLGNVSRYEGSETTNIIDSVSYMSGFMDGHYDFLCDYDSDEAKGTYYYWDGITGDEPVLVAEDIAGIKTGDID